MKLFNFTPHPITILGDDGKTVIHQIDSCGCARVSVLRKSAGCIPFGTGISLFRQTAGPVIGLPNPEDGCIFIVSALVRLSLPSRKDLASPGVLVRDDGQTGNVIGCVGLDVN